MTSISAKSLLRPVFITGSETEPDSRQRKISSAIGAETIDIADERSWQWADQDIPVFFTEDFFELEKFPKIYALFFEVENPFAGFFTIVEKALVQKRLEKAVAAFCVCEETANDIWLLSGVKTTVMGLPKISVTVKTHVQNKTDGFVLLVSRKENLFPENNSREILLLRSLGLRPVYPERDRAGVIKNAEAAVALCLSEEIVFNEDLLQLVALGIPCVGNTGQEAQRKLFPETAFHPLREAEKAGRMLQKLLQDAKLRKQYAECAWQRLENLYLPNAYEKRFRQALACAAGLAGKEY